jgi:DNA-directed RNA polymerase sigma subunit (sigma70/sigma32)
MASRSQKNLNTNTPDREGPLRDLFSDAGLIGSICNRAPLQFDEQLHLLRLIRKEFDSRLGQIARFPRALEYLLELKSKKGVFSQKQALIEAHQDTVALWDKRGEGGRWTLDYLRRLRQNQKLVLAAMEELHSIDDYPYARELRLRGSIQKICASQSAIPTLPSEERQKRIADLERAEMLPVSWIERAGAKISVCDSRISELRNELTETNARFIKLVLEYTKDGEGQDDSDLVQSGAIGLLLAAERYREEKGGGGKSSRLKFTTIAAHWIRREIAEEIRNRRFIRIPAGVELLLKELERAGERKFGDGAPGQQIPGSEARRSDKRNEIVRRGGVRVTSFNRSLSEDSDQDLGSIIKAPKLDIDLELDKQVLLTRIETSASLLLDPTQRLIFDLTKGVWRRAVRSQLLPVFNRIGSEIGVSGKRVDQIHTDAFNHLYWHGLLQSTKPESYQTTAQRILMPYQRAILRNLVDPEPRPPTELELVTDTGSVVGFEHQTQVLKQMAFLITLRAIGASRADQMLLTHKISSLGRFVVARIAFGPAASLENIAKLACDQGLANPKNFMAPQAQREFRKAALKLAPFLRRYSERDWSYRSAQRRRS